MPAETTVPAEMMTNRVTTDRSVLITTDRADTITIAKAVTITTGKADTTVRAVIITDKTDIISRDTTVKADITGRAVIITTDLTTTDAPDKADLTEADNAVL